MTNEAFCRRYEAEEYRSRTGATVTKLAKLSDAKYRNETGLYLAEGVKLAEEALAWTAGGIEMVLVSQSALENTRILACAETAWEKQIPLKLTTPEVFEKLATEKAPQGIMTVLRRETKSAPVWNQKGRYLLLDTIQDPGNVGTILRSAAAFGADGVILYRCADPTGPKTVRASMGALFRCPVWSCEDLAETVRDLQKAGHRVLAAALEEDCMTAGESAMGENDCIIIGNEGHGIDPAVIGICDAAVKIPMAPGAESLNASIAASILLWECWRTCGQTDAGT